MDLTSSFPGSPVGAGSPSPLQSVPLNQQRERDNSNMVLSVRRVADLESGGHRDSSVHDKINQFNSLAMQSKQLERKTADAALKRAMLGREEAECEMRRYRDEARLLRKQIEEGKERERRVGERLETVMENYGRAKETHAHTQDLWEKEIRRARKETFKSQSAIVKLREEVKLARDSQTRAEEALGHEKERSKAREQEAFQARYGLVGIQEQLDDALERVKMLEQERDAFKTLAKNEAEVARIAAEGKLPLPKTDDEFASPRKPRISSVSLVDVTSSAASEAEIEEVTEKWMWEKQRADRAFELVDFLEAECHLKCCRAAKSHRRLGASLGPRKKGSTTLQMVDPGDLVEDAPSLSSPAGQEKFSPRKSKTAKLKDEHRQQRQQEPRRSTVFVPTEGIFRTVSQQMAESMPVIETKHDENNMPPTEAEPPSDLDTGVELELANVKNPPSEWPTPPVDSPSFAVLSQTSLLSLLDAPHTQEAPHVFATSATTSWFMVPTISDTIVSASQLLSEPESANRGADLVDTDPGPTSGRSSSHERQAPVSDDGVATGDRDADTIATSVAQQAQQAQQAPVQEEEEEEPDLSARLPCQRPHTAAAYYAVKTVTTTTKVPLRDETDDPSLAKRLLAAQRTPGRQPLGDQDLPVSFDATNPALTPTMTREEALAQIRERRGRARSLARGTATPHKGMMVGVQRRDISAPTGPTGTSAVVVKTKFGSVGRRVRT